MKVTGVDDKGNPIINHKQEDYLECPECGKELEEEWGLFQDFSDEYGEAHEGLTGYRCPFCEVRFNCQGEEVN